MDNEAFRFLWAVKNGMSFTERTYEDFAESWRVTEEETNRLVKHILGLKPHRTFETFSLNEARRIIVNLAKPLAKISQSIQAIPRP